MFDAGRERPGREPPAAGTQPVPVERVVVDLGREVVVRAPLGLVPDDGLDGAQRGQGRGGGRGGVELRDVPAVVLFVVEGELLDGEALGDESVGGVGERGEGEGHGGVGEGRKRWKKEEVKEEEEEAGSNSIPHKKMEFKGFTIINSPCMDTVRVLTLKNAYCPSFSIS